MFWLLPPPFFFSKYVIIGQLIYAIFYIFGNFKVFIGLYENGVCLDLFILSACSSTVSASGRQSSQSKSSPCKGGGDMESRLTRLEQNFDDMRQKQCSERVADALKNVRILAGRPKLTSPSVLLASMEVLVEAALKAGHSDTDFFSKALQACRQYENIPDLCNLCLKLFGSSEDKKISSAIAEWVKTNKHESKLSSEKEDQSRSVTINTVQQQPNVPVSYPPFQFPAPYPIGYPGMGNFPGHFSFWDEQT